MKRSRQSQIWNPQEHQWGLEIDRAYGSPQEVRLHDEEQMPLILGVLWKTRAWDEQCNKAFEDLKIYMSN